MEGWKAQVIDGNYHAWCIRSDDCSYAKKARDTEKNRRMIFAMMQGHGNAHVGKRRRTKKEMQRDLGLLYWMEM